MCSVFRVSTRLLPRAGALVNAGGSDGSAFACMDAWHTALECVRSARFEVRSHLTRTTAVLVRCFQDSTGKHEHHLTRLNQRRPLRIDKRGTTTQRQTGSEIFFEFVLVLRRALSPNARQAFYYNIIPSATKLIHKIIDKPKKWRWIDSAYTAPTDHRNLNLLPTPTLARTVRYLDCTHGTPLCCPY